MVVIDFFLKNSQSIAYLASAAGIVFVGFELGLKFRAEKRLKKASEIEADIKLVKLFSEIMDIAHARKETVFSEKALELLVPNVIKENVMKDSQKLDYKVVNDNISSACFFVAPVGRAAQIAAIAAVYMLGTQHKILKQPAFEGLKELEKIEGIKSIATKYLKLIEKVGCQKD